MLDPYRVLQITRDADQPAIKEAYIRLMREHHPDRLKDGDEQARHARAKEINAAFALLKSAELRAAFDTHMARKQARYLARGTARRFYRPRVSVMARQQRLDRIRLIRRLLLTVSLLSVVCVVGLGVVIYTPIDIPWDLIDRSLTQVGVVLDLPSS